MEIAIVDSNVLTCLGLRGMLADIVPLATIRTFSSFMDLMDDTPYMYAHYYVASRVYFEHSQFFREQAGKTIVLLNGDEVPQLCGVMTLNICQDEKSLAKDILSLHNEGCSRRSVSGAERGGGLLSNREIEVAVLIVKGLTNKEVADRLNVSLTTIISHRKNIMEKLSAHSLADVIIYMVMNGYVSLGEI